MNTLITDRIGTFIHSLLFMLDPLYDKPSFIVDFPLTHGKLQEEVNGLIEKSGYSTANLSEIESTSQINGAIIYLNGSYSQALSLVAISSIGKDIFLILPDAKQEIPIGPFKIHTLKEKHLREKINEYIQKCTDNPIDASIKRSQVGYSYTLNGNIKINPYKGLFISVDHPDGSGASTLCKNISNFLTEQNLTVFQTEEPTGELFGGIIRTALRGRIEMYPDSLQLLYTIDRIEHMRLINSALKNGDIIVSSRFAMSTLAYSYKELPLGFLLAANSQVYWPDINLLINNVGTETSINRINKRLEKLEKFDYDAKLKKVSEGLDTLSNIFRGITHEIDGAGSIDLVAKEAIAVIKRHEKYMRIKESL